MSRDIALLPEHEAAYTQLVNFSHHDPEGFRLQATEIYANFSPQDRAATRALENGEITAYDMFNTWQTALRPLLFELESNQLKPAFHKSVAKYLVLDSNDAAQKIEAL